MKPSGTAITALLAVFSLPHAASGQLVGPDPSGPRVVVFQNVNLIPMDRERVEPGQTVVVQDGRIGRSSDDRRGVLNEGRLRSSDS